MRAFAVGDQVGLEISYPSLPYHDRVHRFPPLIAGNADHRAFLHRGMAVERVFHLRGVHVFAAGDDHVLQTIDDEEKAVFVEIARIAGVHVAASERLGSEFGLHRQ